MEYCPSEDEVLKGVEYSANTGSVLDFVFQRDPFASDCLSHSNPERDEQTRN